MVVLPPFDGDDPISVRIARACSIPFGKKIPQVFARSEVRAIARLGAEMLASMMADRDQSTPSFTWL